MLNIALTKGRLEKPSLEILEASGYGIEALREKNRKLIFKDTKEDVTYFLAKSADTLTYVSHGVADIGFVGSDNISEFDRNFYELLDLGFGKCKFILATQNGRTIENATGDITIGTKYPNVAKKYFNNKGYDVNIIKIDGSVELAPLLGLADGIVDIMETGTTLRENDLYVVDEIGEISCRAIVNRASFRTKSKEIKDFYERIKSCIK